MLNRYDILLGKNKELPVPEKNNVPAKETSFNSWDYEGEIYPGSTLVGAPISTYGVSLIQVYLEASQNCSVYVDQDQTGTNMNWDINDHFIYYAPDSFSRMFQAVSAYARIRVINNGESTAKLKSRIILVASDRSEKDRTMRDISNLLTNFSEESRTRSGRRIIRT